MKTLIDGVEILGITVEMKGKRQWDEDYDWGGIYITRGDRKFIIDVTQSYTYDEDENVKFELGVEIDYDTFPKDDELKYDITKEDLMGDDIKVELYIGGTFTNEILVMGMLVEFEDGTEKYIKVTQE